MREDLKNYNARHHGIIGLKQTLQLNGFKPWCLSTLLFCLKYSLDLLSNILTPLVPPVKTHYPSFVNNKKLTFNKIIFCFP